ncbi:MAG: hypothetical protein R2705_10110 [Ilumatobacteraceae bacterium]
MDALQRLIAGFVDVGTSKFVVIPMREPTDEAAWETHLTEAAEALLPLQT